MKDSIPAGVCREASSSSEYDKDLENIDDLIASLQDDEVSPGGKEVPYISRPTSTQPSGYSISTTSLSSHLSTTSSSPSSSGIGKRKASETFPEPKSPDKRIKTTATDTSSPSPDSSESQVIIASSKSLNSLLRPLHWGIQWELARIVTNIHNFTYEDILWLRLRPLKDKNNQDGVPSVTELAFELARKKTAATPSTEKPVQEASFQSAFRTEYQAKSPWEELDKEHDYLSSHSSRGKLEPHYMHNGDWYGGKVIFPAKLVQEPKSSEFKIILERPYLGASSRFTRMYGSHRFIRVKIPKNLLTGKQSGPQLLRFFQRPFILNGYIFYAFYGKENGVFLFRTDEVTTEGLERGEKSFLDFLRAHNDLQLNRHQTMAKWASRFALGLSNSVPGIRLNGMECMHLMEPDIISPAHQSEEKPPNDFIMSDGCGYANANFFKKLQTVFNWNKPPTAIQCRLHGAKGLLLLHPDAEHSVVDEEEIAKVWIRESQTKILHPNTHMLSPGLLTVDVLRSSRMKAPARLSVETIVNFAENGVDHLIFEGLIKEYLRVRFDALSQWDGPAGPQRLWYNISKIGAVISARRARMEAGVARLQGWVYEDREDTTEEREEPMTFEDIQDRESTAWWEDVVSGCPSSLEETVMTLLDASFTPDTCPILACKLAEIVKIAINSCEGKFRAEVPMSCSAFVVPDPFGVLEAGEVHIKSSENNLTGQDGKETNIIEGDVLLTRHPCKLPTDVQRATAVIKQELRNYTNVIIVSTKGHMVNGKYLGCHLASMTGGGDYDGDLMNAFWYPPMVKSFKSADPKYAVPPVSVNEHLVKTKESVDEFLRRVPENPVAVRIAELQKYLLGSLLDVSAVGTYSTYWEKSIYKNGYSHPETLRLGHLFCKILDGIKTGDAIQPDQAKKDAKYYGSLGRLSYVETSTEKKGRKTVHDKDPIVRAAHLGKFIMDRLRDVMNQEVEMLKLKIGERIPLSNNNPDRVYKIDKDLIDYWDRYIQRANQAPKEDNDCMMRQLKSIREHTEAVYEMWREQRQTPGFTDRPIEKRQDVLRSLSQKFAGDVKGVYLWDKTETMRLKAAYAYIYTLSRGSRFPFDVAMRSLCEIKANASSGGQAKTVSPDFYRWFVLHPFVLDWF